MPTVISVNADVSFVIYLNEARIIASELHACGFDFRKVNRRRQFHDACGSLFPFERLCLEPFVFYLFLHIRDMHTVI